MSDLRVTVVVINWKLKDETVRCLQSLERIDTPCRIVVVDNGSGDGSTEYLARHYPHVELIALPTNAGFGAACNRAIAHALQDATCEYVLLLNNDATVHPKALSELLSAAQVHPEAGILSPKVYRADAPNVIWYAGARRRRGVLAAADTGRGQVDRGQFNLLREVDYVFGAAMLIRRSVFERIGLFDERFFLYLEDMDLSLRAQAAGFSLLFVPQAHVWHKGSTSTSQNAAMRKYHFAKSTICFLKKHILPVFVLPAIVFWVLVLLRNILTDLAQGDSTLRPYWSGLINGLAEARRT